MAGRGFLKNRLAQIAKESDDPPPNPVDLPKTPDENIQQVLIPVVSTEALVAGQQQAVRGRRVMNFSHKNNIFKFRLVGKLNKYVALSVF